MEVALMNGNGKQMDALVLWKEWREVSIDYLKSFYARFGVEFDEWAFESDQVPDAIRISDDLIQRGIAAITADKLWAIREIEGKLTIRKSDNSTLYITRYFFNKLTGYKFLLV